MCRCSQLCLIDPLTTVFGDTIPDGLDDAENQQGQQVIDSMSTIRAMVPSLHEELRPSISRFGAAHHQGAQVFIRRSFATLPQSASQVCAALFQSTGSPSLIKDVLPSISNALEVNQRQGAIECVYHLIHTMEDRILPYVIFLIVPVLGRMSDSDSDVRLIATTTFATLVKLVPLEAGIPDPPGLSEELLQGRERERKFMAQMLDFKKVEAFEIPVAIKATLRSYQQEGVNWLAFLNRYHLHGILCDDMGLGKNTSDAVYRC